MVSINLPSTEASTVLQICSETFLKTLCFGMESDLNIQLHSQQLRTLISEFLLSSWITGICYWLFLAIQIYCFALNQIITPLLAFTQTKK